MKQITLIISGIILMLAFAGGYRTYPIVHQGNKPNPGTTIVTGNIQTKVVTVVKYVTKPVGDPTDVKISIPKPDLIVNVNGQSTTFNVADSEQYLFQHNRLELNQSSRVNFEVTVKPIDLTKRWGIGIGYLTGDQGLTGIINGPIVGPFDFTGTINDHSIGAGAIIRF